MMVRSVKVDLRVALQWGEDVKHCPGVAPPQALYAVLGASVQEGHQTIKSMSRGGWPRF